jgi:hypothetical protein
LIWALATKSAGGGKSRLSFRTLVICVLGDDMCVYSWRRVACPGAAIDYDDDYLDPSEFI